MKPDSDADAECIQLLKESDAKEPSAEENAPPTVERQRKLAQTMTSPAVSASNAIRQWSGLDGTPFLDGLIAELETQIAAVESGHLDGLTARLSGQALTLEAIFYTLARSAFEYRGSPYEADKLRLALKAQAHCRATIQSVADLKNPRPTAYVQQANIANGPQQVNNDMSFRWLSDAEKRPNELLEQTHGTRLDPGTTGATGVVNTDVETVGAVHRAKDERG